MCVPFPLSCADRNKRTSTRSLGRGGRRSFCVDEEGVEIPASSTDLVSGLLARESKEFIIRVTGLD